MVFVLPQVAKLKGIALDFLFPQWCVGCGRQGEFICLSCRGTLPRVMPLLCPRCGKPQSSGVLCPACATALKAAGAASVWGLALAREI